MKRVFGTLLFRSAVAGDSEEGYTAVELFRTMDQVEQRIARVIFWDAYGDFFVEIQDGTDVPLIILEELISEARRVINDMQNGIITDI